LLFGDVGEQGTGFRTCWVGDFRFAAKVGRTIIACLCRQQPADDAVANRGEIDDLDSTADLIDLVRVPVEGVVDVWVPESRP
jgi:hypothetical protein